MISRLDTILKWLWLINGIVLLVLMGMLSYVLFNELFRDRTTRNQAVAIAPPDDPKVGIRAIRYDSPDAVYGSSSSIIRVRYGRAFEPASPVLLAKSGSYRSTAWSGPVVNAIFLDSEDDTEHLLLDRPAYIDNIDYPESEHDLHQTWISYEIALEDSTGDGQLDDDDDLILFISDLHGRNLKRILPEGLIAKWHGVHAEGSQILIFALDRTGLNKSVPHEQLPQRALVFDVDTGKTEPYSDLNEIARMAGQVVSK